MHDPVPVDIGPLWHQTTIMPQLICLKLHKHEIFLKMFRNKSEPYSTVGII